MHLGERPVLRWTAYWAVIGICFAFAIWVTISLSTGHQSGASGALRPAEPIPTLPSPVAKPAEKTAIFVGDSYTANPGSYALQVCDAMRWECRLDAEGSTGYTADGHLLSPNFSPYIDRLPKTATYRADYIFVAGGRNDTAAIKTAAPAYLKALRKNFPKARIFVLAPFWNETPAPVGIQQYRSWVRDAARKIRATWIDTDGWLNETMIGPDHVHPSLVGQDALASHLQAALKGKGVKPPKQDG